MKTKKELRKERIINRNGMVWMLKQYAKRGQLSTIKALGFTVEEINEL